jgi:N-glycosylase/DNA lyase
MHKQLVSLFEKDGKIMYQSELSKNILDEYFQLDVDMEALHKNWSKDENFAKKSPEYTGLRILKQPKLETVFSFICSQNNNISRITSLVNKLCVNYGEPVGDLYAFPDLKALLGANLEQELRELGFGYRAKYIAQTAKQLHELGPEWLDSLPNLPYEKVKDQLLQLSGVGPKVADCIALFCMDQKGCIPVDTHVWNIATRDYHLCSGRLNEASYQKIGIGFRNIFGEYAGWAHTILFAKDLKSIGSTKPIKNSFKRKQSYE